MCICYIYIYTHILYIYICVCVSVYLYVQFFCPPQQHRQAFANPKREALIKIPMLISVGNVSKPSNGHGIVSNIRTHPARKIIGLFASATPGMERWSCFFDIILCYFRDVNWTRYVTGMLDHVPCNITWQWAIHHLVSWSSHCNNFKTCN